MRRFPCSLAKLAGVSLAALLVGCAERPFPDDREAGRNEAMVRDVFASAAANAIVTEHALYPYHFRANEAALNGLGERCLEVLTAAYRSAPGPLVVLRGDSSPALYDARVKAVLQWLATAGVNTRQVPVSADLPGGPGVPSARALKALDADARSDQAAPVRSDTYTAPMGGNGP